MTALGQFSEQAKHHAARSEALLADLREFPHDVKPVIIAEAQVRATLALQARLAMLVEILGAGPGIPVVVAYQP